MPKTSSPVRQLTMNIQIEYVQPDDPARRIRLPEVSNGSSYRHHFRTGPAVDIHFITGSGVDGVLRDPVLLSAAFDAQRRRFAILGTHRHPGAACQSDLQAEACIDDALGLDGPVRRPF